MGAARKVGGSFLVSIIWAVLVTFGAVFHILTPVVALLNQFSVIPGFSFLASVLSAQGLFGLFLIFAIILLSTFIECLILLFFLWAIGAGK